ncbi:hypothetical protein L3X38_011571 [Prunus dulcis]|uniref:Transposable element protein n=1 Tax=Prunus dulcis TaxID=3755 RepID=A0AAD4WHS6_PRUDU|nr:hypothetical protein L3X38_011571 [Prunus dulcis]
MKVPSHLHVVNSHLSGIVSSLTQVDSKDVEPSCFSKAVKHAEWRTVMATEFSTLQRDWENDLKYLSPLNYFLDIAATYKLSLHCGEPLLDPSEYRQVVSALQYLTLTRPDLSFDVNQVCQFMHSPTKVHWQAVKRILQYSKATYDHGLRYQLGKLELNAYFDANYTRDLDTRHSIGGFCVYFGFNLISWRSKKQKTVGT